MLTAAGMVLADLTAQPVQQAEERLQRGVVAAGTELAHRAVQAVIAKGPNERAGPELAAPIRVQSGPTVAYR